MNELFKSIGKNFNLNGELISYERITNGNVNSTYKVSFRNDNQIDDYLFQKINVVAFHRPEEIMQNIDQVTSHIHEHFPEDETLIFYSGEDKKNYYYDEDDSFWRVMNYVDSITYNTCDDNEIIKSVGEAFGHFAMQLSDFDGSTLFETIPDFHNTEKRLQTFLDDVKEYAGKRTNEIAHEISYIEEVKDLATLLSHKYNNNELPVRVTHNDTKCNNVLFDKKTFKPIVVIDYDTIMPGMTIYDFGDAVRSIANNILEDEEDLSKVFLDIEKFKAFSDGYFSETKNTLTNEEIESMALGAFSITIELASRFLDDYIKGDVYFHIDYPKQNLNRGRCQLALAKDMLTHIDEMNDIIKEMCK